MQAITIDAFHSFTLAILLLFAGKALTQRSALLRRYSIPEPVIGGFLCAGVTGLAWLLGDWQISFELGARDMLLLYFFAAIGLKSDVRTLLHGAGRWSSCSCWRAPSSCCRTCSACLSPRCSGWRRRPA